MIHPLDPLSPAELTALVAAARAAWKIDADRYLISMIQLEEPPKQTIINWIPGDAMERAARITILDRATAAVSEGVITVDGQVRSFSVISGAKSPVLGVEADLAIDAAKADPRVVAGLRRRGIHDVQQVHMEMWPIGAQIPRQFDDGRRVNWTPMWFRPTPEANYYAHPIHGLHAIVDLDTSQVLTVEDNPDPVPIPSTPGNYRHTQTGSSVELKELAITQPQGGSFRVEGWRVLWERWSFRIGFCQREGLVLHDVRFCDSGTWRRVAYRLSIAELVIPYGDPSQGAFRKNAFDTGEYGLGNYTNSLTLGCDCLGFIQYLDVAFVQPKGNVVVVKNAICMHEEDHGILWKHVDQYDRHAEVRRSRRFVVSSIYTVNNYEYGYYWYFYQDGSIEFEAKLTGIVLTVADAPGRPHPSATQLELGLWAPYHQHLMCARLDIDVDGENNCVLEVDAKAHPQGPLNPHGGAYHVEQTLLASEKQAQRVLDVFRTRHWRVVNRGKLNHVGTPVGYKLVPGANTFPLALPDSTLGKKAGFMYKHLWVSRNTPGEKYPAGDYPFQHKGRTITIQ
jgi:primary-amine oxidase